MSSAPPPEPAFAFLGLTIVRKTDLLAATAFLLAAITTIYQFWGFVRGAELAMYPPDRVVLLFDKMADGRTIARLAGDLTLINSGQPGRDAVLRDVDAVLSLDGKPLSRQRWLSFARITRDGDKLSIVPEASAHPLQVAGGATISQTVSFAPRPEDCGGTAPCAANYIGWDDFIARLLAAKRLRIDFEARTFGSNALLRARCEITVSEALVFNLSANGWHSAACVDGAR